MSTFYTCYQSRKRGYQSSPALIKYSMISDSDHEVILFPSEGWLYMLVLFYSGFPSLCVRTCGFILEISSSSAAQFSRLNKLILTVHNSHDIKVCKRSHNLHIVTQIKLVLIGYQSSVSSGQYLLFYKGYDFVDLTTEMTNNSSRSFYN